MGASDHKVVKLKWLSAEVSALSDLSNRPYSFSSCCGVSRLSPKDRETFRISLLLEVNSGRAASVISLYYSAFKTHFNPAKMIPVRAPDRS